MNGPFVETPAAAVKPGMAIVVDPSPTVLAAPTLAPNLPGLALPVSTETLKILKEEVVPTNDLILLAQRLEGKGEIPLTIESEQSLLLQPGFPYQTGNQDSFWVTNSDTNDSFQVYSSLKYITDHVYFWVEDGIIYDPDHLARLAEEFDKVIYPTTQAFFGSEWSPGIDGDAHLYILYAKNLGDGIAGYFSSKDQYHPLASEYSNGHEMFLLNADVVELDEEFAYAVLAHEYQHMIHWNIDRDEESWVNEGFSELAAFINGYGVGFHDYSYIEDPDIQLTHWPVEERGPHYGAAFLFLNYFLNRFGNQPTQAVVSEPLNGMVGIDQTLSRLGVFDPVTGQPIRADDVFADWVLASYLKDSQIEDGRYHYANYPDAPQASETELIEGCPSGMQTRDVSQYGVDYIEIKCRGDYTLKFEGSILAPVLPIDAAYSGDYFFWSNRGDEATTALTREFDFSGVTGPLTLNYKAWFDLEKDYDYLYLEASTDGGKTWDLLVSPSGTAEDPTGNSYGWGYNGLSGDPSGSGDAESARWIDESVDLSRFAEERLILRFEYVTDAAVSGEGFALDDVAIPEINYFSDFETDEGGWIGEGFVRIQNVLPQTYRLSVIQFGQETTIDKFTLTNENTLEIPLTIGKDVRQVVLVVSGTTPFTRHKTAYRFELY